MDFTTKYICRQLKRVIFIQGLDQIERDIVVYSRFLPGIPSVEERCSKLFNNNTALLFWCLVSLDPPGRATRARQNGQDQTWEREPV